MPTSRNPSQRETKEARVHFRTELGRKAQWERAAALQGMNLTAFAEQALDEQSARTIEQVERVKLSARDSRLIFDMLENPPEPTSALLKAARDYKSSHLAG